MSAFIKVSNVGLELATDFQRRGDNDDPSGLLATVGGSDRRLMPILQGIDFEAHEGDRIGLLGLNGAGKSTLLRVLNGAFPPTRGSVESSGTMQSLLNSTLGFADKASVVENVFLRGTAMGLRRSQLKAALPDILAFAGLESRANYRLHALSSGQLTRLGFAISTCVQPDILLMDEWIATGDAAFMQRAQERLLGRFQDSRIVVLASHSTALLREMCNKLLVLDQKRMAFFGSVPQGLEVYGDIVSRANADLRKQIVESDPLLYGAMLGVVERIRIEDGVALVEGWATTPRGGEIGAVTVELLGQRHVFPSFERIDRSDVRHHVGQAKGRFGFRVSVPLEQQWSPELLAKAMVVSTGRTAETVGAPLPTARGAVLERVEAVAGRRR